MPARPRWSTHLNEAIRVLSESERPFVDRTTVEELLGVGRRRAQQILAPCVSDRVGSSGLASREHLILHLKTLADSHASTIENRRRQRFGAFIQDQRSERLNNPALLVEAPAAIVNQSWVNLPPGITVGPGYVHAEFSSPEEGLQLLLQLAMAIGNDFTAFVDRVSLEDPVLL